MKKFFAIIIFLLSINLFAPAVLPQEGKIDKAELERQINEFIASFRDSKYYEKVQSLIGVRNSDPSVCKSKDCRKTYEEQMDAKRMAVNRCGDIAEQYHVDFCNASIPVTAELTENGEKIFNAAYMTKDINVLSKSGDDLGDVNSRYKKFPKKTQEKLKNQDLEDLGIYWGYKYHGSYSVCQKYLNQINLSSRTITIIDQLACEILFYPDAERAVNDILRDLGLFQIAKQRKDTSLCSMVRSLKVKKVCLDPRFTDIKDLM